MKRYILKKKHPSILYNPHFRLLVVWKKGENKFGQNIQEIDTEKYRKYDIKDIKNPNLFQILINNSLNHDVIFLPPTKASSLHKRKNLILGEYIDK
jgi:hypothetical protein